jgi:hypothetical protein
VDDAIRTSTGALTVQLGLRAGGDGLRIEICADGESTDRELLSKLAVARARIVLIGGTLQSSVNGTTTVLAELPCAARRTPAA